MTVPYTFASATSPIPLSRLDDNFAAVGNSSNISFQSSGAGAVAATVQSKITKTINVEDFGAVGNGVTDDYAAISAAIAYAVSLGGADVIFQGKVYAFSQPIVVNVSGVKLIGKGAGYYSPPVVPVTQLLYTGTAGVDAVTFTSIDGASNYKVFNVGLVGIGVDGNALAARGVVCLSINESVFNYSVRGCTSVQTYWGTVTALASARDPQRNFVQYIRVLATGAQNGIAFDTTTTGANISLNTFGYLYAQHATGYGIRFGNCDNNLFMDSTAFSASSGTGIILAAGNGTVNACRDNVFMRVNSSNAIISEGTSVGYPDPAENNAIYTLDKGNGTPDPTVGTGSTIQYGGNNNITRVYPNFVNVVFAATQTSANTTRASMTSTETARFRSNIPKNIVIDNSTGDEFSLGMSGSNLEFRRQSGTGLLRNNNPPTDIGASCLKVNTITGTPATLDNAYSIVLSDATAGNRVINLPLANTYGTNRSGCINIRRIDASGNTVTVQRQGTDTLNGGTSETLAAGQGKTYVCNGTSDWYSF